MANFLNAISNRQPRLMDEQEYFISAVLLPVIVQKDGTYKILFEVRSQNLDRQPGEICFPGGKIEEGERPVETALREASEELGLQETDIELVGALDFLVAPIGTVIYPYAGKILKPEKINPAPQEVAEVFTVPLDFFLHNPPMRTKGEVAIRYGGDFPLEKVPAGYGPGWKKRWSFTMYYYQYGKYFIWGLTSKILVNFIQLISPPTTALCGHHATTCEAQNKQNGKP